MELLVEIVKFFIYSFGIVIIAKYMLVPVLRKLSELLGLGAKATGNIAGIATSVPELLTVSFSAYAGFISTGIYNVLSSNVINLVQYLFAIYLNKNQKYMSNKAIKVDIFMVIVTIILPILMIIFNVEFEVESVIFFLLLLILFYYINFNVHKLYLKKQDEKILEEDNKEYIKAKKTKHKVTKALINVVLLILIAISLYVVGNLLSDVLTNLNNIFKLPELVLGITLGIVTSIPELITFIEAQRKGKDKENNEELGVVEATNNLLTSNVLNLFAIQSIGIIIYNIFCQL